MLLESVKEVGKKVHIHFFENDIFEKNFCIILFLSEVYLQQLYNI